MKLENNLLLTNLNVVYASFITQTSQLVHSILTDLFFISIGSLVELAWAGQRVDLDINYSNMIER